MADELLAAILGGVAGAAAGGFFGYFSARSANTANRAGVRLDVRLDSVDNGLESLTREAIAYWRTAGKDAAAESKIKGLFEDVGSRIHNLSGFGVSQATIEEAQAIGDELNDLVTGGTFEQADREPDDEKLEQIRVLASNISKKFHPHRP
ncbi:TPA: hypothetical protein UL931_000843 [Stenotrophomonas maltophilia]|nr:hypothetical protein [Stenotrophomonas maltophilia]